jgi:hypothetical protein
MAGSALQFVDLFSSDGTRVDGLVPVMDDIPELTIDERVSVFDAKLLNGIDFVFFRRFSDGRSSQVAAYIIDNSDEKYDEKQLAEIHQRVWLHGKAPLLYISWPSRIDILTCARGPDFWKEEKREYEYNPARKFNVTGLKTASDISDELKKFSAWRLADGTFWEEPSNRKLTNHDKAAHQLLIQAVVDADKELKGEKEPILRRLLLLMILIKYLEDRRVFPENWFGDFHSGAENFFEVLKGESPEEVYRLLEALEKKFNGDIFSLKDIGQQRLTRDILIRFAEMVEGKTLNFQRNLWKLFSFEHLPVEIISHLYEKFVKSGVGAVYTPPILVSLLLDHVMPYEKLTGEERILDPACGSGVFLVGAFRRLINVWRSKNQWRRPDVNTLKKLLKTKIFGIEIDKNAIDLTAFSLCLAVCDALQPAVIWNELKFDRLRGANLIEDDFFQVLLDHQDGKSKSLEDRFDVVIGNPPFVSKLSSAGTEIDRVARKIRGFDLPDKQAAFLFLEQTLKSLRPGGRTCLIQPSGFLYNPTVGEFRRDVIRKYKIDTIFDFTSIRKLYEAADPKTIAILAGNADVDSETHWIRHWTFRRTVSVQERICFELDHYDRHRVSQTLASEGGHYVWRAQLFGGGRLANMGQRFRSVRKLIDFMTEKGWSYAEGFVVDVDGTRVPSLKDKPLLPTNAFTDSGVDTSRIDIVREEYFKSGYNEDHFKAPLVLIKENESLPIAFWNEGPLAYKNTIVGIHAPPSEISELKDFYTNLRDHLNFFRSYLALTGTVASVGKATKIRKQDIDQLPYPDDMRDLSLSFWEKVLCDDVSQYMNEFVRLGQNSALLQEQASPNHLEEYCRTFVRMLGSVYDNLVAAPHIQLNGLTCQPFYFGAQPDFSWLGDDLSGLKKLIYDNTRQSLRTIRVLRYYSENVLLIVKPDRLRYWIRSVAIRDADETLFDLRRQGY